MIWRDTVKLQRFITCTAVAMVLSLSFALPVRAEEDLDSLLKELPSNIEQITNFGQRADFSHDGKRILFIEKTYGDVFEVEIATKAIRPITHHYHHEGYTRALYLSNGDILLSGSSVFDAEDPTPSRRATAELWVLDKALTKEPVALGEYCAEGPAVSRTKLRIAWAVTHDNYPDRMPEGASQLWLGDISYGGGKPSIENKRKILDTEHIPLVMSLEAQNFRPPEEKELIFSAYELWGGEVMGIDLETLHVENYSRGFAAYEEPEGIFPDGEYTCVERVPSQMKPFEGNPKLDIWKLKLDRAGSVHHNRKRTWKQLTFFSDYGNYRGTNPVISDDGRFMAFQLAKSTEQAGVGHGIFILDLNK